MNNWLHSEIPSLSKNDNYAKPFSRLILSTFVKIWTIITRVLEKTAIRLCLIV